MWKPDQPNPKNVELPFDVDALNIFLSNHFKKNIAIQTAQRFGGGFSNLTFLLTLSDGNTLVMRTPPKGANIASAHDMGREFRVLNAISPYFSSIPTPIVAADADVLGIPFFIMSRSEGVVLRANDATDENLTPPVCHQISDLLLQKIIDLHAIDLQKTGLHNIGKPEGYVKRQVEGWIKRYEKSKTDHIPNMEKLAEWLPKNLPQPQIPTLLHNDFKFDNLVFSTDLSKIEAVLDWEMATVGDPLMDLGAMLAYWCEAEDDFFPKMHNLTWRSGFPTRQEMAQRYADATGRNIDELGFYLAFGFFKNAVIAQQIYARWKQGIATDPRFEQLIFGVKTLAKMGFKEIK
ncbi:MAG: hypothetical protein RL757_1330 [Bacteroidota bacterium]|jgi:aminoglycoside phosphotransferase (APT) family kinase protein